MTTIDALIRAHGVPRFIKIDIEGYEAEALRGLSQPVFALSIEFVPMMRINAEAALDRLMQLGDYSLQRVLRRRHAAAPPGAAVRRGHPRWLRSLGDDGPAGDLRSLRRRPAATSTPVGSRGRCEADLRDDSLDARRCARDKPEPPPDRNLPSR